MFKKIFKKSGFTMIEVLVTTTILVILATVTILLLDLDDVLKQGRDSNRATELGSLNSAIRFLTENEAGSFIGTSNVVYISIPDTSVTCSNLIGLPILPSGWNYNCAEVENLRKVDGTGWIPVNFQAISAGSPLSQLPIDPENSVTTGNYFSYTASGGSWELAFSPEADKNKLGGANNLTVKDGGTKASLVELGKDLSLLPLDYGDATLTGFWNFDESSGSAVVDRSGGGNDGTMYSSAGVPADLHFDLGCRFGRCLSQNGSSDYFNSLIGVYYGQGNPLTVSAWVFASSSVNGPIVGITSQPPGDNWNMPFLSVNGVTANGWIYGLDTLSATMNDNDWNFLSISYSESNQEEIFYLNGAQVGRGVGQYSSSGEGNYITTYISGAKPGGVGSYFSGQLDNIRIYNRVLSAAEIKALFDGGN